MGPLYTSLGIPKYNGFIAFGVPHQGAYAANTLVENPDLINAVLNAGCDKLGAGPSYEAAQNEGVLGKVGAAFMMAGGIVEQACDAGVNSGFDAIFSFAEQGLEDELTTSAASDIPPMATQHNAAFYAIEDGHDDGSLMPRFLGTFLEGSKPNDWPVYGADASDAVGIAEFAAAIDFYASKRYYWYHKDVPWYIWASSPAGAIALEVLYDLTGDAYDEGVDWLESADDIWQELIGAKDTKLVQVGCACTYYDYGNELDTQIFYGQSDCSELDEPDIICEDYYILEVEQKLSDGFILAESAMDAPGVNYPIQFMPGTNHMQMRNNGEMEKAVDKIFLQGLGREYFGTNERE
jgi:hypothetical protein